MTGATYRQLDHWCRHGVFGEDYQNPGSGQRRRFNAADILAVAIITRLSTTLRLLTKDDGGRAGSAALYADVVSALRGETIDGVVITNVELSIKPTPESELYVNIGDLRLRFHEEVLTSE